ncbi:MAG: DUF4129 domain-containing protein [Acidobacteriota bacterium]
MKRVEPRGAIDLLDGAIHLLRTAPTSAHLAYVAGTGPFVVSFLFFWTDMLMSARADRHVVRASLLVTIAYLWMKAWQAHYAARLRCHASGGGSAPARLALAQIVWQPWSLVALPIAVLVLLPFGWVYAFFQSIAVTGDRGAALRQASLWPKQNAVLLSILALLALFVFANVLLTILVLPSLLQSLLGIGVDLPGSPFALLNGTTAVIAVLLTYGLMAPLTRAVYALRCADGDAILSGEDLRSELRLVTGKARVAMPLLLLALAGALASAQPGTIPPDELDASISATLERPEFGWRLRRIEIDDGRMPASIRELVEVADRLRRWVSRIVEALRRVFERRAPGDTGTPALTATETAWIVLVLLLFVVVPAIAILVWRHRRRRARPGAVRIVAPRADAAADDADAAAVPDDEWTRLSGELAARGEWRLAMRALHLASLSRLARADLLALSRGKSNLDYQRELSRRGRHLPSVCERFAGAVALLEPVWYGDHHPDGERYERMRLLVQDVRVDAAPA